MVGGLPAFIHHFPIVSTVYVFVARHLPLLASKQLAGLGLAWLGLAWLASTWYTPLSWVGEVVERDEWSETESHQT